MAGTDVMVKFNTLLAILSLLPTLVFTVYGLPELQPSKVTIIRPHGHARTCCGDCLQTCCS